MSRATLPPIHVGLHALATGINLPTVIKEATLPGRRESSLLVATQPGIIYEVDLPQRHGLVEVGSSNNARLLLDIRDRVIDLDVYDERGLIGMEFHPDFARNGIFYIYYSEKRDPAAIAVEAAEIDPCVPSSKHQQWEERSTHYDHIDVLEEWRITGRSAHAYNTILRLTRPFFNHNGVNTLSWYRGRLVLTIGDGGLAFDPFALAQNDNEIFGKIIALDVMRWPWEHSIGAVTRFSDLHESQRRLVEVLGKGLRNPSSLELAGDIYYLIDVGQNLFEEVNAFRRFGLNFGWRAWEGVSPTVKVEDCPASTPTPTRTHTVDWNLRDFPGDSGLTLRVAAGDSVRFRSTDGGDHGLVEVACDTFAPLARPKVDFRRSAYPIVISDRYGSAPSARKSFDEEIPFDRPGSYCFVSPDHAQRMRVRVEVSENDDKRYTMLYPTETFSLVSYRPFIATSHTTDRRTAALSGGRVHLGGGPLDRSFVFADWSELDAKGQPTGKGALFYARPDERDLEHTQPFGEVIPTTNGNLGYFTTVGANNGRTRLFLGTYSVAGGADNGKGAIYELV